MLFSITYILKTSSNVLDKIKNYFGIMWFNLKCLQVGLGLLYLQYK